MVYPVFMVTDQPIAAPLNALGGPMVARVLVVDDEEPVTLTIQGILELDGYAVTATTSGEHALELIGTQQFDVVLTDLRLDGMDGIDLLRALRRQSPECVSIVLTGYTHHRLNEHQEGAVIRRSSVYADSADGSSTPAARAAAAISIAGDAAR